MRCAHPSFWVQEQAKQEKCFYFMLSKHISNIFYMGQALGSKLCTIPPYCLCFRLFSLFFDLFFLLFSSYSSLLFHFYLFISSYCILLFLFFSSYSSLLIIKLFVVLQTPLALSSICLTQSPMYMSLYLLSSIFIP